MRVMGFRDGQRRDALGVLRRTIGVRSAVCRMGCPGMPWPESGLSEGGNVALGPVGEGAGRTAEDLLDVGADALFGGGGLAEDGRQRRLGDSRYDRPGAREVRGIQMRPDGRDPA